MQPSGEVRDRERGKEKEKQSRMVSGGGETSGGKNDASHPTEH